MKQILYCYGDSNTWGFDSRSWLGERYPKEARWTGILEASLGCRVVNDGMNGRKIPSDDMTIDFLAGHIQKLLGECPESGKSLQLLIMLGTNDLLTNPCGGAADAAAKMDRFLARLLRRMDGLVKIRLIAPPHLCRGAWDIPLLYDGVHFSEEGHRAFAKGIMDIFL